MKRTVLALCLVAAMLAPAASSAATNEVRICGTSDFGRTVAAGNYPAGGIPRTKCAFAWDVNRAIRELEAADRLETRFGIRIRGQQLDCTLSRGSLEEIRCRNPQRFVLLYRSL